MRFTDRAPGPADHNAGFFFYIVHFRCIPYGFQRNIDYFKMKNLRFWLKRNKQLMICALVYGKMANENFSSERK